MKKTLITLAVLAAVSASPAHAISAKYREQLIRSGCTQDNDGHTCDSRKTKAQNQAAARKAAKRPITMGEVRGEAETILAMEYGEAMNYLKDRGWKTVGLDEYEKGGHRMRVVVESGVIRNGQLIK